MTSKELQTIIENNIRNTQAIVVSDDNVHFSAIVISELFESISSKVKQQQMIYALLKDYINSGELHAFSLKTFTPEKWQIFQAKK
jgi:acid stress-induced BolA-like protein IbaG/YrbA